MRHWEDPLAPVNIDKMKLLPKPKLNTNMMVAWVLALVLLFVIPVLVVVDAITGR